MSIEKAIKNTGGQIYVGTNPNGSGVSKTSKTNPASSFTPNPKKKKIITDTPAGATASWENLNNLRQFQTRWDNTRLDERVPAGLGGGVGVKIAERKDETEKPTKSQQTALQRQIARTYQKEDDSYAQKYAGASKSKIDTEMKSLEKDTSERGQYEYNWLKQNQYNYWTTDQLKSAIKAKEKQSQTSKQDTRNQKSGWTNATLTPYQQAEQFMAQRDKSKTTSETDSDLADMRRVLTDRKYGEELSKLNETELATLLNYGKAESAMADIAESTSLVPKDTKAHQDAQNKARTMLEKKGYSPEEVDALLDYSVRAYNQQEALRRQAAIAKKSVGGKIAASVASVPMNLVGGPIGYLDAIAQRVTAKTDPFTGQKRGIDYNSRGQMLSNTASDIRGTVSKDMNDFWSFIYNTGMSIADFASVAPMGGAAAEVLLGTSAAQSAMQDAHRRGASDDQALAVGLTAGLAEATFEHISLEKLRGFQAITDKVAKGSARLTAADVAKSIGVQSFTEGSEEVATSLANTLTDAMIMADKSEINTAIQQNKAMGMSEEEATRAAWKDWAKNLALDFAGGALSGGVVGSTQGIRVPIYQARMNRVVGDELAPQGTYISYLKTGLVMPRSSASRQLADSIVSRMVNGEAIAKKEFGRLANTLTKDIENGFTPSAANDSTYELHQEENGDIVPNVRLGPIAESLTKNGMNASQAVKNGNLLSILLEGDMEDISPKQIKKLAINSAVRKTFEQMTGKILPQQATAPELRDALKESAIEYREEQAAAQRAQEEAEAQLAEAEAVAEAQAAEQEQAVTDMADQMLADADSQAEAQAAQVADETDISGLNPPAKTREEFIEEYRNKILEQDGINVTDKQAEKAWQKFSGEDGVLLDDGRMIGRDRFFKEMREFYANRENNPIDLDDEQLEDMYQAMRSASRTAPRKASGWSVEETETARQEEPGAEVMSVASEQTESPVTEETAEQPKAEPTAAAEETAVATEQTEKPVEEKADKTAKKSSEKKVTGKKTRQKKNTVIPTKAEVEAKQNAKSNAKANETSETTKATPATDKVRLDNEAELASLVEIRKNIDSDKSKEELREMSDKANKGISNLQRSAKGEFTPEQERQSLDLFKQFTYYRDAAYNEPGNRDGVLGQIDTEIARLQNRLGKTAPKKKATIPSKAESNSRQSVTEGTKTDSVEETAQKENVQTNKNVSQEQLLTALYLKPYLKKLGINRIIFDGDRMGDADGEVRGDTIYLNENLATSTRAITKIIGHELIHPATSQTRKESGDVNKSVAEDVISFAERLSKDGMLSKTNDGETIRNQLENIDKEVQKRRERYTKYLKEQGASDDYIAEMTTDAMMREEIAADWFGIMLRNQNILERLAGIKPDLLTRVLRVIDRIRKSAPSGLIVNNNRKEFMKYLKELDDLTDRVNGALERAKAARDNLGKDTVAGEMVERMGPDTSVETNEDGELVFAQSEDGQTTSFSIVTYAREGKDKLRKALEENGHSVDEINDVLNRIDDVIEFLQGVANDYSEEGYENLATNLMADILTDVRQGKQVLSAMVKNGDYPVNFDLALICKKRVAYMRILGKLVEDGVLDQVTFDATAIAKVNEILRDAGFETACLGCFVESRRQQIQDWAEAIVTEWNAAVDARVKNAEGFGFAEGKNEELLQDAAAIQAIEREYETNKLNDKKNIKLSQGNTQQKMGELLDKAPSLLKHLTVADLLTPQGITALRQRDKSLFSLVQQRYGANSPKIVQEFNPYNSEIADLTFKFAKERSGDGVKGAKAYEDAAKKELGGTPVKQKGETTKEFEARKKKFNTDVQNLAMRNYLYDIGGIRMQSFSDFMIENVLDYVQMYADMAAKRVPMHGYTKEITCLRLFGMTGAKWNGSLIAHVDPELGEKQAGLLPVEEASDGRGIVVTDPLTGKQYAICFDDYQRNQETGSFIQSIGFKDVVALQLDPRYSANVGSITIGVSDAQIRAMLNNPLFSMVIPYHKSGMNPLFAKLVGVSVYNDYTKYQSTTRGQKFDKNGNPIDAFVDANGNKIDGDDLKKSDTKYDFNHAVQEYGDAKAAAEAYLEWCGNEKNHPVRYKGKIVGYEAFNPKFSNSPEGYDFTTEENYYKLLEDFTSYDSVTGESAVQGAVTMTFPEANGLSSDELDAYKQRLRDTGLFTEKEISKYADKAQMGFKDVVRAAVEERSQYQKATEPKFNETYEKVKDTLLNSKEIERSTLEERRARKGKTVTGEDIEDTARQSIPSDEEYMAAVESGDTARAQEMVDEAAKRAGYDSPKLYHGTNAFGFTEVDVSKSDDGISFFATSDPKIAATYTRANDVKEIKDSNIGKRVSGDYRYKGLRFDTKEERDEFRKKYPNYVTELELDQMGLSAYSEEDFDKYDDAEDERQRALDEYKEYESERLVETTARDLYEHPERYTAEDLDRFISHMSGGNFGILDFVSDTSGSGEDIIRGYFDEIKELIEDGTYEDFSSFDEYLAYCDERPFGARAVVGKEYNKKDTGIYALYANLNNTLELDAKNHRWNDIQFDGADVRDTLGHSTRSIAKWAKGKGYGGVVFQNIRDNGMFGRGGVGDVYVFFDPQEQVKSADPVTYDKDGNVIPLSERFNPKQSDIRYSLRSDGEEVSDEEADADEAKVMDSGVRFSLRTEPPPKKTQYGFKLMTVDEKGRPHAMFIDAARPYEIGVWYNADSPELKDLVGLEKNFAYEVDENGNVDESTKIPIRQVKKVSEKTGKESWAWEGKPSKKIVQDSDKAGKRWMAVVPANDGKGTDGKGTAVYNIGINGSGTVSVFALRPGIHAVDIPSMAHIGAKSGETVKETKKGELKPVIDTRRPDQRWFLIEYPVDEDYNQEAYANPDKDIKDHLPKNGWYSFQTNSGAEKRQHWFITGAMKIVGAVSEEDVRKYARDRNFEEDLPWRQGKSYNEDEGTIDLDEYIRTTDAQPTPSKKEMGKRIRSEAKKSKPIDAFTENGRYSLPGENPDFDEDVEFLRKYMKEAKLMSGMERAVKKPGASVATKEGRDALVGDMFSNYGMGSKKAAKPKTPPESKLKKNTYNKLHMKRQFGEEHAQAYEDADFTYDRIAEEESMARADERLRNDYDGEKNDLSERNWHSSEDLDTAMGILATELRAARDSGDFSEVLEWLHIIREQATQAGQFIQAFAKYNRTPEGVIARAAEDLRKTDLSKENREKLLEKITQFAVTLDALKPNADGNSNAQGLVDLIVAQAKQRNTPVPKHVLKALQRQVDQGNIQYLYDAALTQLDQIAKDYVDASTGKKIATFQTIMHLLNLKTANRNLLSNTVFGALAATANNVAMMPDLILSLMTGGRSVGFDAGHFSGATWKGIKDGGSRARIEAALDIQPDAGAKDKYGTSRRTWKMTGNFVQRNLSRLEKAMAYELNWTDEFRKGGVRAEIIHGLAPLVANGTITMDTAKAWANEEALYRTFQDDTYMNKALGLIKKLFNMKVITEYDAEGNKHRRLGQVDFGMGDIIQKYTQVPGALLTRAFEFAPTGYLKAIYQLGRLASAKKAYSKANRNAAEAKEEAEGKDSRRLNYAAENAFKSAQAAEVRMRTVQRDAALAMGRAMTGTGLIAAIAWLAKMGLLHRDDDEMEADAKALRTAQGITGTQLNFSALGRLLSGGSAKWQDGDILSSVEFLEPINNLLTMGTKIAQTKAENEDANVWDYTLDTADALYRSILEIPTMQTAQTIYNVAKYHQEDDPLPVWADVPIEVALSGATGFVASPIRQLAQATDPYYRDTYAERGLVNKTKAQMMNALPYFRQQLPTKLDSFGRERTQEKQPLNALNAFIMPGTVRTLRSDPVANEVLRLYEETGEKSVLPARNAPYSVDTADGKKQLTGEERRTYQKTIGSKELDTMDAAMKNPIYKDSDNDVKADVWSNIKSYAGYEARKAVGGKVNYNKDGSEDLPTNIAWSAKYDGGISAKAIKGAWMSKAKADAGLSGNPTNAELIHAVTSSNAPSEIKSELLEKNVSEAGMKKFNGAVEKNISPELYVKILEATTNEKMPANGVKGGHKSKVNAYLDDLVKQGILTAEQATYLKSLGLG